ncbi:unnamed protein product, partial [Ectocarpus sp. 12 AP-2014]
RRRTGRRPGRNRSSRLGQPYSGGQYNAASVRRGRQPDGEQRHSHRHHCALRNRRAVLEGRRVHRGPGRRPAGDLQQARERERHAPRILRPRLVQQHHIIIGLSRLLLR